jgi:hypothetical protein
MHPHAHDARRTGRAKMKAMSKSGNLDIPIMKAVGENQSGGIRESSSSMQMKRQAAASGMKRGGRFGKHRSKTKPDMDAIMAANAGPPPATPPVPALGAAGAMPTAPAPPMQKRGGRHHYKHGGRTHHEDEAEDKAIIKHMVKGSALKGHKHGGRMPFAGHVTHGGAFSGVGRLEKVHSGRK